MKLFKTLTVASLVVFATGCASLGSFDPGSGSAWVVKGPGITRNHTPITAALMCTGNHINKISSDKPLRISVGDISDLTGKYDDNSGYRVTQGASLMAVSALGKLNAVKVVERGDTKVFEFDMELANKKLIDDGVNYRLPGSDQVINYRPVLSGSVNGSDYYITGGITEVNYNIRSAGVEAGAEGFAAGTRQYAMNVALDLRLVNARNLEVVEMITLQKQVVGYETKAGVFRFFGATLIDLNTGNKADEPLQLAIRTIIEQGVIELVGSRVGISKEVAEYVYRAEELFDDDAIRNPSFFATEYVCPEIAEMEVVATASAVAVVKPKRSGACGVNGHPTGTATRGLESDWSDFNPNVASSSEPTYAKNGSVRSGYYAQMSTHPVKTAAQKEWACLEQGETTNELFDDREYAIKELDRRPGWHAVLVGPIASKEEAAGFCKEAKGLELDCYIRNIK